MVINKIRDIDALVEKLVPRHVNKEVVDRVIDKVYYDPQRPSLGDNWRSYIDSRLVEILKQEEM